MIDLAYMKRQNRDRIFKELKSQGFNVRRTSVRNQSLHPQYVEDCPNTLSENDKGFGNTVYKTHFGTLFLIEEVL